MNRFLLILLIFTGCVVSSKPPATPVPPPLVPVEIKDFVKIELSNKSIDSLNAWLRENPNKQVVTFFLDRHAYVHTIAGDNVNQRFVQVDGDVDKVQSFLNERACKVVAIAPNYYRAFILCITEE